MQGTATHPADALHSLGKGLDVLSLFVAQNRSTLEVRHVMEGLGLPRRTAYRLVAALEARQFLVRGPRRGTYAVGSMVGLLSLHLTRRGDLVRTARPFLRRIVEETGEAALLTVQEDRFAQCIDFMASPDAAALSVGRGARIALHAGASGLIFLAYMDRSRLDAYLASPLRRYTPRTVTDPDRLRVRLRRIRANGHALSDSETGPNTTGLCVPVWADGGRIVAAMTLSAPTDRRSRAEIMRHLEFLQMCAAELSEHLPGDGDQDMSPKSGLIA